MSEEKKKPIVSSDRIVSQKEKIGKRFVKSFLADDVDDIKLYLFEEGTYALKKWALGALERMWFKDGRKRDGKSSGYSYERPSYSNYYQGNERREEQKSKRREEQKVDYSNIILELREDAEKLIFTMKEQIRDEGFVSVADLFNYVDIAGDYVDNDWGWDDERDIGIRRVAKGYLIDVAKPKYMRG